MNKKGIDNFSNPNLLVDRKNYSVILYQDTLRVKQYKAVFGNNDERYKRYGNDKATPNGEYYVCKIDTNSKYHKFLQINYPNQRDAAEALKNEYISKKQYREITRQLDNGICSPDNSPLSADIGIHGIGEYNFVFKNLPFIFNWTNGSAAVSNEAIDEIHSVVTNGTRVKFTH